MSERRCEEMRDDLPDLLAGDLEEVGKGRVEEHLETCAGCRARLDLLRELRAARPEPPEGLERRIEEALLAVPAGRRWMRIAVPVAAALVVALGTALLQRGGGRPDEPAGFVWLESVPAFWHTEDGVVAGAPLLDELSEEVLENLLQEMEG